MKTIKIRSREFTKSDFMEETMNINYNEFQGNEYVKCDMTDEEWETLCSHFEELSDDEYYWDKNLFGWISHRIGGVFHKLHFLRCNLPL